jgi:hypothetical protein
VNNLENLQRDEGRLRVCFWQITLSDVETIFDLGNLRRAYRWTLSNPDARYKSYFRDSYSAFALASDTALKKLRQRGLSDRYVPAHASKVMIPKSPFENRYS